MPDALERGGCLRWRSHGDSVEQHDALLVVDEAYGEFAPWSAIELVDESRALVVVRTYSKGMLQRLGLAARQRPALVAPKLIRRRRVAR